MTAEKRLLQIARRQGVIRSRELKKSKIHPENLRRLCAKGLLTRVSRGLYVPTDADFTTHQTLAEASKKVPKGIICLLSALSFHEIGTQLPHEVWIAIDVHAWAPEVEYPPIRLVRFSGPALSEGIEEHIIEGVSVKVTDPGKTVADCFKFRNKIGLDVALEALRECQRAKKCTPDQLWKYAKICRVSKVMRPYMEAVV